tara:strand:- start:276 stop:479 length:204 start_codon:yes stop_codon:yes gene_type:complete
MSDYIVNDKTYFLSGSKIFVTDSDKSNGTEMTLDWFINQQDINISHILDISTEVSGSNTYMIDRGWM